MADSNVVDLRCRAEAKTTHGSQIEGERKLISQTYGARPSIDVDFEGVASVNAASASDATQLENSMHAEY